MTIEYNYEPGKVVYYLDDDLKMNKGEIIDVFICITAKSKEIAYTITHNGKSNGYTTSSDYVSSHALNLERRRQALIKKIEDEE